MIKVKANFRGTPVKIAIDPKKENVYMHGPVVFDILGINTPLQVLGKLERRGFKMKGYWPWGYLPAYTVLAICDAAEEMGIRQIPEMFLDWIFDYVKPLSHAIIDSEGL